MNISVKLRKKKISNGRLSLYLDFYPPIINKDGKKTRREFLKLHIIENPSSASEKQKNKKNLLLAEKIREARSLAIYNKEYGFKSNVSLNIDFIKYYSDVVESKMNNTTLANYQSWQASHRYYKEFAKNIYSDDLNKKHVEEYKKFLLTCVSPKTKKKLSSSTIQSYFGNFLSVLSLAYQEDILKKDLTKGLKNIKVESKVREYFSIEELNQLWKTPISDKTVKHLCFFCVYTGFRFAEAIKITWNDISKSNSGEYTVKSFHSKTGNYISNPIPKEAYDLLLKQEQRNTSNPIFKIGYHKALRILKEWVIEAGINKKVGLHNFRHTYAILQLENGTDVFTVSKMLGHTAMSSTMHYAKVTDKLKKDTVNKIKLKTYE